jgi:DNA-binding response OmpR family regulator
MRVLIAANDVYIVSLLRIFLKAHYVVDVAATVEEASYMATVSDYDGIVIDSCLDETAGKDICIRLREEKVCSPILILLSENCDRKRSIYLDNGADMCLEKPFESSELLSKLRTIIRKSYIGICGNKISAGELTVNIHNKTLERGDAFIDLRKKEFELIEYLVRNKGNVVTKETLLEHIWESGIDVGSNTLEVHINRLREKVDRDYDKKLIKTVYGFGYKIEA